MRIKLQEITFLRLLEAAKRRILAVPEWLTWSFTSAGKRNNQKLLTFQNKHKGERCFIIANGPSLAKTDLSLLQGETTFCMNRIYLMFDKLDFTPNYYVVSNELILEQFATDIANIKSQKFLNWNRNQFFTHDQRTNFLRFYYAINEKLSTRLMDGVYSGGTVTHACLQLAYFMGFSEVYIVGMDHNFVDTGVPSKTEVRKDEIDKNHFHPNYFPKGSKWQLPDLNRCEYVYQDALDRFNADGRNIYDLTIEGKCTIFPKKEYLSVIKNGTI
jgi:hypothetical protein